MGNAVMGKAQSLFAPSSSSGGNGHPQADDFNRRFNRFGTPEQQRARFEAANQRLLDQEGEDSTDAAVRARARLERQRAQNKMGLGGTFASRLTDPTTPSSFMGRTLGGQ